MKISVEAKCILAELECAVQGAVSAIVWIHNNGQSLKKTSPRKEIQINNWAK